MRPSLQREWIPEYSPERDSPGRTGAEPSGSQTRSIYDELDELRASMDYLYQLALDPADNPLLPTERAPGIVCRSVHNLNAEVAELDHEVTVTLDTARGSGNSTISVDLIDENSLIVSCCDEDRTGSSDATCRQERRSFSLNHRIPLPCKIIPDGAGMSVRNGVLDIHLKKHPRP